MAGSCHVLLVAHYVELDSVPETARCYCPGGMAWGCNVDGWLHSAKRADHDRVAYTTDALRFSESRVLIHLLQDAMDVGTKVEETAAPDNGRSRRSRKPVNYAKYDVDVSDDEDDEEQVQSDGAADSDEADDFEAKSVNVRAATCEKCSCKWFCMSNFELENKSRTIHAKRRHPCGLICCVYLPSGDALTARASADWLHGGLNLPSKRLRACEGRF
eukprot:6187744-Pleurochrysis_carterae.AAC.12